MPFSDILRSIAQILVFALAINYCLVFFRGTRAGKIIIVLACAMALYGVAVSTGMTELVTVLKFLAPVLPIILCVLFQPELRQMLAGIVEHASSSAISSETAIETVVRAVGELSEKRIGALITFERSTSLVPYEQHGRHLDAPLVGDLLVSIFYPHAPMHDGAVIIRKGAIAAAGCVFPVAIGKGERRNYGTRHRAAIGITEETDAVAVVVSEETGLISIAFGGGLERPFSVETLRGRLSEILLSAAAAPTGAAKETAP